MRVAIADPDINIETARRILAGTGAVPTIEHDNWTGGDVAAIIVSPEGEVRAADLDRCPNVKIVDLAECQRRGVLFWHPTDYCSDEVADTAIALLLCFEELFKASSAVTVHVPLNDSTRELVSEERISLMPMGSVRLNLARDEVVNVEAVLTAISNGRLFGAALDVLQSEPPSEEHPAPRDPRLIVTPHAGWYSQRSADALFLQPLEVVRDALLA